MTALPSCRSHVGTAIRYVKRKWLLHQRSDVKYQLHMDYPKIQLLPLTLKFPVLRFCALLLPAPETALRSFFNPSPLAGIHQKLFHVALVGVRRVLPLASVKNQGPFYLLLSLSKNPLREIILLFLKPQLRKAKPLTGGHTAYKWGCGGSNQSLAPTSHAFPGTDHL